ncbi:MAG TPA: hypothetical protein VN366_04050 [Feifaniaceae bacterium]|nr:hypothetical protein [Feifaniaceae bacterium]
MPNNHEQDLFAPTQGLARAPLFRPGPLERGGYGQPDPGSGILPDAGTVPWTVIEPDRYPGPRAPEASAAREASVPEAFEAAGRMNPAPRQVPSDARDCREVLRGLTGRSVVAEFMLGPVMQRRAGILTHVGAGYFVLRDPFTQAQTGCDLHSLRFLTVLPEDAGADGPSRALWKFGRL